MKIFLRIVIALPEQRAPGKWPKFVWSPICQVWAGTSMTFDGPWEMYNKYREGVVARGACTSEADRQMDIIERMMRERPDAYRAMFNNIYRTDNTDFLHSTQCAFG
jgi:hypothetical protein